MTRAIHKSLELLTETPNEASVAVLLAGLDSADSEIQQGALLALLARRGSAGQREVIRRWSSLDESLRKIIGDHPRQVSAAVRHAVLSQDRELCESGCDALLRIGEFDLIPALVTAVEDPGNPRVEMVARTLLRLSESLHEEINGPSNKRRRFDPTRIQQDIVPRLQRAVDRYDNYRRPELIEAFLLLTNRDNSLFRDVLAAPRHPSYLALIEILRNTMRMGTIRLVLNCLPDRTAPSAAIQIIAHRADLLFVRQLLKRVADPSAIDRNNLRRIDSIAWLQDDLHMIDLLNDHEQQATVTLALASGMNRLQVFEVMKYILQNGKSRGRRAASAALAEFGGAEACQLTLAGLEDRDPHVQANMVLQLRERGIAGAVSRIVRFLDDSAAVVREAARKSLKEFTFDRYLSVFDMMDDGTRQSTGMLVMRIDPTASSGVAAELKTSVRSRRLRGLEAAAAMGVVCEVEALVIGLLRDEDHFVRAAAAHALIHCDTTAAREALRRALMDESAAVRDAAESSLRWIAEMSRNTAPSSITAAFRQVESSPLIDGLPTEFPK